MEDYCYDHIGYIRVFAIVLDDSAFNMHHIILHIDQKNYNHIPTYKTVIVYNTSLN